MEPHRIALHHDGGGEGEIAAGFRIVEVIRKAVGAIRNRLDPGAHFPLGIILQRLARRQDRVAAVFGAEPDDTLRAQPVGRHLRAKVGDAFAGQLAVQQDEVVHVRHGFARAVEPDRRDAQPFLIDMRVAAVVEIRMMGDVDGPGGGYAIDEDRLGQHDIRQMRATALIPIIPDEDIAGLHRLNRVFAHDVGNHVEQAAEMHRDVLGLAERHAVHVEQRG